MPILRLQVAWQIDSAFARDAMVITPHFNDSLAESDEQGLCDDLADALEAWDTTSTQVTVKSYDAQGTPPVFPNGTAVRNEGVIASSNWPREVAVCLSYYSERNIPRQRGRLYIPIGVMGSANTLRPDLALRTKVGELASIFANLGGTDVDWVVYSRSDDVARPVSHWWVDDEWDTIRSRGMRATTRLLGTVDE